MSVSSIFATSTAANTSGTSTADRVPQQSLDQSDFLQLLVAQMTTQDPLKPMDDTSFIAEMANFTALENSSQLVKQMEKLAAMQESTGAQSFLGQTVTITDPNDSTQTTGLVTAVSRNEDGLFVTVGGVDYDIAWVTGVELSEETSTQD